MKKRKGLLLLLALAMVAIVVLVGCGKTAPVASTNAAKPGNAPAPAPTEVKSLVDQFKDTGHAKYFTLQVAKGPEGTAAGHYGDSCISCHSAVKMMDDKNAKLADFFPGGKYAGKTEGISCRVCHKMGNGDKDNVFSLQKEGWSSCGDCHTGTPKLGSKVNHPQNEFIKGVAPQGGTVKDMPSAKFQMKDFSCQDCHVTNSTKHDFLVPGVTSIHDEKDPVNRLSTKVDYSKMVTMFDQKKCQTCHASNAQDTVNKMKQQQEEIGSKLKALEDLSKSLEAKVKDLPKDDPKLQAYNNGITYFSYVEGDSSKGIHNYPFAKTLLEAAENEWKKVQ